MNTPDIDAARLTLALTELRLPAIKALWPRFAEQADKEGWSEVFPILFRRHAPWKRGIHLSTVPDGPTSRRPCKTVPFASFARQVDRRHS